MAYNEIMNSAIYYGFVKEAVKEGYSFDESVELTKIAGMPGMAPAPMPMPTPPVNTMQMPRIDAQPRPQINPMQGTQPSAIKPVTDISKPLKV